MTDIGALSANLEFYGHSRIMENCNSQLLIFKDDTVINRIHALI